MNGILPAIITQFAHRCIYAHVSQTKRILRIIIYSHLGESSLRYKVNASSLSLSPARNSQWKKPTQPPIRRETPLSVYIYIVYPQQSRLVHAETTGRVGAECLFFSLSFTSFPTFLLWLRTVLQCVCLQLFVYIYI